MTIQAIETVYNGYRFRSRLEARWAVFFDVLGLEYVYEPEGFDMGGTWYLPDFWLSGLPSLAGGEPGWWVEIKGDAPTEAEHVKAALLAQGSHQGVMILWSRFDEKSAWADELMFYHDPAGLFHSRQGDCLSQLYRLLVGANGTEEPYSIENILINVRLEDAREAARQARFEHGETPGPAREVAWPSF